MAGQRVFSPREPIAKLSEVRINFILYSSDATSSPSNQSGEEEKGVKERFDTHANGKTVVYEISFVFSGLNIAVQAHSLMKDLLP